MALAKLFLTFVILVVVIVISNKVLSKYHHKAKYPMGVPATFLVLIAISLGFSYICQYALELLDDMRHPDFWISVFRTDPVIGEFIRSAEEYNIDLNIPTAEIQQIDLLAIEKIGNTLDVALWCAITSIAVQALYIVGLLKKNRILLVSCLLAFAVLLSIGGRASGEGFVHLVNYLTRCWGTTYDGDISNSIMLPFFTWFAIVIASVLLICGASPINKFVHLEMQDICNTSNSQLTTTATCPSTQSSRTSGSAFLDECGRSKVEKLTHLKKLFDADVLTEEEFNKLKRQILNK